MTYMHIAPTALGAAADHVRRTWGEYGYGIVGIEAVTSGAAVHKVTVRSSDGGTFSFLVTRYGNVVDIPENATTDEVTQLVRGLWEKSAGT